MGRDKPETKKVNKGWELMMPLVKTHCTNNPILFQLAKDFTELRKSEDNIAAIMQVDRFVDKVGD